MESKILAAIRRYDMVRPGDTVVCAVSGGADSMALLWCMCLLKEKLGVTVQAAHFNHNLRGEESRQDAEFVRSFCDFYDIPFHYGQGNVTPGKKGLEAAAREARYTFLRSLPGVIATAHTADDNAETVLMHLVRGSGLRGLGGITPKSDGLIRPMLDVTRQEVEAFLAENYIRHREDSSNRTDQFLRNRLRHQVMPLLKEENPRLATGLSAAAQRLRQDEELLQSLAEQLDDRDVQALRTAHPSLRRRALENLLKREGFPEPSASHILQAEQVVFSENPSAMVRLGDLTLTRQYERLLVVGQMVESFGPCDLPERGTLRLEEIGLEICITPTDTPETGPDRFTISPMGRMVVRSRQPGDKITLPGGTKLLKKLFIDRKIPQHRRGTVPVIADEGGILGVRGIGPDEKRRTGKNLVRIEFVTVSRQTEK